MGAEDMGLRAASQALQVQAEDVTSEQLMRMANKGDEMVFISFAGKANFAKRVRQFLYDHPSTCCLFVDYLGYLKSHKKSAYDEVNEISQSLKEMAVEYNLPVFALHQLSRENEKEKRPPRMDDLRDSGCLEQDADKVLLIHRPERHDANGAADIYIEKNRAGPTGVAHLSWKGSTTSFLTKGQAVLNPQKVEFEEMDMDLV
jgi:replicative DNA helicase